MTLNAADSAFADRLKPLLDAKAFRDVTPNYLEEPRGSWHGHAGLVLAPGSTQEVAHILREANAAGVPVVPYGGGTGLVGGQIMPDGPAPVILSMERMTQLSSIDARENVIVVEAGMILEELHKQALSVDRLFPLTIAAKGSARIGGILGTNAGGVNVLRYGNARDLCLGLEVVFADGRVMNTLSRLRKDNTGYDLRNLMIGSEGTLGVITAAALKLSPIPAGQGTALAAVPSPEAALTLLSRARDKVGECVSAFELISGQSLEFLAEKLPQIRRPFDPAPEWMVLVELGLPDGLNPAEVIEDLIGAAFEDGLVTDALIAQSQAQADEFWEVREQIPEANRLIGAISSHDISLPLGQVPGFIDKAKARLADFGALRINCFGHLGDGNLHFNAFPPAGEARDNWRGIAGDVKSAVHDLVHDYQGSVSAEHGIGRLKTGDLERYGDPVKLAVMRQIKDTLDPRGILNPGAVLALTP